MPRYSSDQILRAAVGERLKLFIDDYLMVSLGELAQELGYATDATLRQAVRGKTYLSGDKMYALVEYSRRQGKTLNLNWLVSGAEAPIQAPAGYTSAETTLILLVRKLNPAVARQLLNVVIQIVNK